MYGVVCREAILKNLLSAAPFSSRNLHSERSSPSSNAKSMIYPQILISQAAQNGMFFARFLFLNSDFHYFSI